MTSITPAGGRNAKPEPLSDSGFYNPVGAPGFEPGTSATRTQRSSRAEPRPDGLYGARL